ncbi:hypothetical protein RAC79_24475, partial [Agrobacterium sp. LR_9]|uniref:hypothetical protein n=1 Tax=Agrobacterium sp. LR_9 TaxID=3055787 RepID=UPI0035C146E2
RLCQNGHRAKLQAWQPREIAGRVAVADIHHEVDLDRCVREEATILATLSRDMLKCCCSPLRHPFGNSQANPQIKFDGIDPLSLLRSLQKENKWPVFTPLADGLFRCDRGRLFHRRGSRHARVLLSSVSGGSKRSG